MLARALDDGPRLARVQVRQAQALALMGLIPGTLESAIDRAHEAYQQADPEDLRTRSYAQFVAGVSCRDLGRFREAIAEFGRGTALFPPLRESGEETGLIFPIYVSLCGWRSEAHAALGDFDAALASAAEALRVAEEIRHPPSTALASAFLGYCRLLKGDIDDAVPALQRGLAIAQERESPHGITANALYLAYALVLLGRHEPGLEALTRAVKNPIAFMPQWTRYGTLPAVAYLLAGRLDEAARGRPGAGSRHRAPGSRLSGTALAGSGRGPYAAGGAGWGGRRPSAGGSARAGHGAGHCAPRSRAASRASPGSIGGWVTAHPPPSTWPLPSGSSARWVPPYGPSVRRLKVAAHTDDPGVRSTMMGVCTERERA